MTDIFTMQDLGQEVSSARQLSDMAELLQRQTQEEAIKRMGAEA